MRTTLIRWLPVVVFSGASAAFAGSPPTAPKPQTGVPSLVDASAPVLCIGCADPFDLTTHKALLKDLASNPFVGELRRALYQQDFVHQFESRAHFDNCDFDSSIEYIEELLHEVGRHAARAQTSATKGDHEARDDAVKLAFFSLGQALHAVQDFYAHSNYVEMSAPKVKRVTDIELIAPWRPAGQQRLLELRNEGLISGYVFWGFPQMCPDGTASHGDLAKDSASTPSGRQKLKHLQNITQHGIAVSLARDTSEALVDDMFKKWPVLKDANGEYIALDVLIDRRGL